MKAIIVIPADEIQLLKYQVFLENTKNIVESHLDTNNMELYNKFSPYRQKQIDYQFVSDLEKTSEIDFPKFSKEQLNSVPDVIEVFGTYKVSDYEKALLLLGEEIKLVSENYGVEKSFILNDNKIFLYDDLIGIGDNINSPLRDDNTFFINAQQILTKILIIMENNPNEVDVKGVMRPLQVNDPVMVQQGNTHFTGKIDKINEDGSTTIKVNNNREVKELTITKDEFNSIKPLFILDKDEKMVYTKFTYDEVIKALNSSEDVKTNFEKGKTPIMGLMLGNKSDVIAFDKKIDDKMAPVEGRLEVKRNSNGQPVLSSDIKFKELNLERPIYGKNFDAAQIDKLKTTGELGLVEGFKSKEGKEFNLWVSLDKELNKVVTKRETDIYIGQIFGVTTNTEQQEKLKSGQGVVLPLKNGKEYYFSVSAATKNANGLKSFTADKAKEFGLIPKQEEEKKNTKSKGMKI